MKQGRIEVRDMGLAAYLKLRGFRLTKWHAEGKKVVFVFEGDFNALKEAQEDYLYGTDRSLVIARDFYEIYMNLRSLMIVAAKALERGEVIS